MVVVVVHRSFSSLVPHSLIHARSSSLSCALNIFSYSFTISSNRSSVVSVSFLSHSSLPFSSFVDQHRFGSCVCVCSLDTLEKQTLSLTEVTATINHSHYSSLHSQRCTHVALTEMHTRPSAIHRVDTHMALSE